MVVVFSIYFAIGMQIFYSETKEKDTLRAIALCRRIRDTISIIFNYGKCILNGRIVNKADV